MVGLTGGIGSGKSTVAAMFASRGVPVIDADQIAREVVEPGQAALDALVAAFGKEILDDEGRLHRDRLRRRIFRDPEQRARLEGVLHPLIRNRMEQAIAALAGVAYCLVAIPLLVETGQRDLVDRILVVDCPESLQRSRAMARDGRSAAEVEAIMAAQADRPARLEAADDVIVNDADRAALERQVESLHRRYTALAHAGFTRT